jgi:hypothetical protein
LTKRRASSISKQEKTQFNSSYGNFQEAVICIREKLKQKVKYEFCTPDKIVSIDGDEIEHELIVKT